MSLPNQLVFTTLFDWKYAPQGLALYRSMQRHFPDLSYQLNVLAMDDQTYDKFPRDGAVSVSPLRDVLDIDAGAAKSKDDRSYSEFCWTMASVWTRHVRDFHKTATYLDSDVYFFSDAAPLIDEIAGSNIVITPHRFAPPWKHYVRNGVFNVSWVGFNESEEASRCLYRWAHQCVEWCYLRHEDGKYADQKYLDSWPKEYEGVHQIKHIGAGTAPWNLQGYEIGGTPGSPTVDGTPVVWYHFHEFRSLANGQYRYTFYPLRPKDKENIYEPYVRAINDAKKELNYGDA